MQKWQKLHLLNDNLIGEGNSDAGPLDLLELYRIVFQMAPIKVAWAG